MLIELLCIVVIYAGAVAYARWVAHRRSRSDRRRHYELVADNHESRIEWYLRSLRQFSRRTGTDVFVTVRLRHSTDETGAIVRQLLREDEDIRAGAGEAVIAAATRGVGGGPEPVRVELAKAEDVARLPI